jgi:hypothetical protein
MTGARWALRTLLAGGVAFVGAGCMLVVGDGDYKVGALGSDAGGTDSEAMDATGSGDTSAESAADGSPAEGSVPSGDGGPPLPCTEGVLDAVKLKPTIQACLLLRGCLPTDPVSSTLSDCITYDDPHRNAGLSCTLVTGASCTSLEACFGEGFDLGNCPATGTTAKCVGNKAITCGGSAGSNTYLDCNVIGGQCGAYDSTGAGGPPDTADCIVVPNCTGTSTSTVCQGTAFSYTCIGGQGYGQNCASRSETCETRGTSTPGCYFHNNPCGSPSITCMGNVIDDCQDGYDEKYDCSGVGLACAVDTMKNGFCVAPGCSTNSPCTASCDADGHTAHLCVGGAPLTVDCHGFSRGSGLTFQSCLDVGTAAAPDPVCL